MKDPTYLAQLPTISHQSPSPSPSTTTTKTIRVNNNISSKEEALLVRSNSGGIGGDQDVDGTDDGGGSAQEVQATAKISVAGLESVLKSVVAEPAPSSKSTTTSTVAGDRGGGDDDGRAGSPRIVRSVSLRTCVPYLIQQSSATSAAAHAKKVQDQLKSHAQPQPLALPQTQQQSQIQQKQQQAQAISHVGRGYEYSPPRQHIYYSHTPHSHTQHHHHHRLHHHHHQHSSSIGGTGSSEKQKKNRRFSYSTVGAIHNPSPQQQQQQQQDTKVSGPGEATTAAAGGGGLNRRIGTVENGSLGLLVDPTPKCCKVRARHPQPAVTTSPVPAPSRSFVPMPPTAAPETASGGGASLSPSSAAAAGAAASVREGSSGRSSDAATFGSSVSSSPSSLTSVSPSSVTEYSHSHLNEKEGFVGPGCGAGGEKELRGSYNRRREKEEGGKAFLTVDGRLPEREGVTGSLASQQSYFSPSSSQQCLAHDTTTTASVRDQRQRQQQQQQQGDHVQDPQQHHQHPLELYRQVLPPTSTDLHLCQQEEEQYLRPRVCKMVVKHPSMKLDWKVPEPIKAGGEVLRGVLVITAKELLEAEVKAAVKSKSGTGKKGESGGKKKKPKQDRFVWIEHIEIDMTGLEEVTTGAGLLSRTRTDRHCFLHKTQVLPIEELKCILDTSSSASFASSSSSSSSSTSSSTPHATTSTSATLSQSGNTSRCGPILSRTSSLMLSSSSLAETDLAQPGKLPPGTQQGISFQMRIPERVGGTYRNAHASISYQLTANVHIRRGKEMFVLQHPLPLSLFELVQIRAATKIISPHDLNPSTSINPRAMTTVTSASSSVTSTTSSISTPAATAGGVKRQAGVRFVIPKAHSVLGTAAVKPYSLWGLGPATFSSSHHNHSYHGHHWGHGYRRQSHQRRGSLSAPPPSASGSTSLSVQTASVTGSGMTRSYSDIGSLSSHSKEESSSGSRGLSSNTGTTTSLKKARFDSDEMLSAEDQYRSRQLKQQQQQQQELELQQQQGTRSCAKLGGRKDSTDGLDEVGFGANIDKSVVAAGENVTMDMFVVKSDVMKVVDIKVTLVETIQIFSLLDHEGACAVVSPIAGRTHVFDNNNHQHQHFGGAGGTGAGSSKRKLVETHMVKIAKAYVPAQAEESHANDNHLKGYYEDYEDARTTKSLSMYKLGMRIPETALTIQDRDLFKVDYMFVIKFFFKGRMGAFLELPIEIVSQYNHNRISTISGAISCVSNSVQIALPPAPILIKRNDSVATTSEAATPATVMEVEASQDAAAVRGEVVAASAKYNPDDEDHVQTGEEEERGGDVGGSQDAEEIQASSVILQDVKGITPIDSDPSSKSTSGDNMKNTSQSFDPSSQDTSASIDRSSSTTAEEQVDNGSNHLQDPSKNQPIPTNDDTDTQKTEEDGILASSRLSKTEFAAFANRQVGLAVARYNQMSSTGTSSAMTTTPVLAKDLKRTTSKPASTTSSGGVEAGVPKIVIENANTRSEPNGLAASSSASTLSSISTTTTRATTTTTVISPALPILFDLTSAALPTPAPSTVSPPVPAPLVIPRNAPGPKPMLMTPGVRSSSMGAGTETTTGLTFPEADAINHSNSFPRSAKDTELHPPKLLSFRQSTNTSIYSFPSREEDYRHHAEAESNKTSGRLVAKIAKSLSSPLLRSRTGTGTTSISPSGSQTNLPISMVSPQHQQSSAFTLAATTLSALTLLSSVGQAAVSSEGKKVSLSNLPPAKPLKSCIKKQSRPSTTARLPGLNTGNLSVGGGGQQARAVGGGTLSATNKKKVTFAKGLTPAPSPTRSQDMLAEPIILEPFKYKSQSQYPTAVVSSASSSSSTSSSSSSGTTAVNGNGMYTAQGLSKSVRTNPRVAAAAAPFTAFARPMVPSLNHPHQQHQRPQQQQAAPTATIFATPSQGQTLTGTTKSPNSASPRARMHHPFDSHPSRLFPLEKKHLDFQITQDLKSSSSQRGRSAASKDLSSNDIEHDEDDEEEDENEEGEEEGEEEYEEEEEDDEEEDDQETEEQRIERRKQVRIAWLAKYGDAFKQVYGAVPELPPL